MVRSYPLRLQAEQDQVSSRVSPPFPVKRLADGAWLVRYGPDSSHGPPWHKAFEVYSLRIYALLPNGRGVEALSIGAWSDGVAGYEIEIADDWGRVTEHRQAIETGEWTDTTFCLEGHSYRECRKRPNAPKPAKRILIQDQN